jgi:hypothetical protein
MGDYLLAGEENLPAREKYRNAEFHHNFRILGGFVIHIAMKIFTNSTPQLSTLMAGD